MKEILMGYPQTTLKKIHGAFWVVEDIITFLKLLVLVIFSLG
jgi:hypothetical protein